MAGDVPPLEAHTVLGWLGGILTASIGAIGLWLAQRVLGKAAFQTAMNDGFSKLNDKLQVEMERREKEIATERAAFAAERLAFAADRIAWSEERSQFKGRIRQLEQQVQGLERRAGIHPTAAASEPEPGATQL